MILCSADEDGVHRVGDNPPYFRPGLCSMAPREAPATGYIGARSANLAIVLIGYALERQQRATTSPFVRVARNPQGRTIK